jgi:hypothetical protein
MSGKRDIRATVSKIEKYTNYSGVLDASAGIIAVNILTKCHHLSRSINRIEYLKSRPRVAIIVLSNLLATK